MFTNEETRRIANNVYEHIMANPEKHDQENFWNQNDCGTTMCVAGWTLFLEEGIKSSLGYYARYDSEYCDISETAGTLLGFDDYEESEWLFYEFDNEAAVQKLKRIAVGDIDHIDFSDMTNQCGINDMQNELFELE